MYEHPSLTITAMLEEQQMLNRAVERRRAILERLESQGRLRPSLLDRVRAAFRGVFARAAARSSTAAADSMTAVPVDDALADAGILVVPVR